MKAPNKIYRNVTDEGLWYHTIEWYENQHDESDVEYIRKDLSDETIELAEDHAYFAGQENFREKVLDWAKDMKHLYELPITTSGRISKECLAKADAFQQMIDKLKTL